MKAPSLGALRGWSRSNFLAEAEGRAVLYRCAFLGKSTKVATAAFSSPAATRVDSPNKGRRKGMSRPPLLSLRGTSLQKPLRFWPCSFRAEIQHVGRATPTPPDALPSLLQRGRSLRGHHYQSSCGLLDRSENRRASNIWLSIFDSYKKKQVRDHEKSFQTHSFSLSPPQ